MDLFCRPMRRWCGVALALAFAVPVWAQGTTGSTVTGIVHDSLANKPLAGAWVQLIVADERTDAARTVESDSSGRYTFSGVGEGRYTVGFFHPLLDSLGVEAPLRAITVTRGRTTHADLAVPSGPTLNGVICAAKASTVADAASSAALVGVVRDVRTGAPVTGAQVAADWLEVAFRAGSIDRRRSRVTATTGANGWFALCNVPSAGNLFVGASRGADSTDLIESQVSPTVRFLRRDLYLGAARAVLLGDSTRGDSLAPRRMRAGDGRVRGTVLAADGKRPLAGALVRIVDGPGARANDRGEWTIVGAPMGSRMLEVRAVGYYPERRGVDVTERSAPVQVTLETFTTVLAAVKVVATRVADRQASGFDERKRSGMGRFLTSEDLERRGVLFLSDAFKNLGGVRIDTDSAGERRIYVRSAFNGYCEPTFYIDGLPMYTLTADEVDGAVSAKRVRAVEVYNEGTVPPQFQQAFSGCGSIVIWTK